jgi:carbon-monoxide dehydrogenase medium subunit
VDGSGKCKESHVAVTGVGAKATRAKRVEGALAGKALDAATIAAAAEHAAHGIDISADLQGSVDYKAHLTRVYARRALEAATARAKGGK